MILECKFTNCDSNFIKGYMWGSIKAQRQVQTPAQEGSGAIEGEQEAQKVMFMGHPLTQWGEKDTLTEGIEHFPRGI